MDERGFGMPITIKTAIDNIDANKYLIPAIQRKFVWTHEKIENLFDSIMRDYPINSFMFWQITDEYIKNTFKFYKFITHYRQRYLIKRYKLLYLVSNEVRETILPRKLKNTTIIETSLTK